MFYLKFLCSKLIDNGLPGMLGDLGWRLQVLPPLIDDIKFGRDLRNYEDINAKNCHQVGTISEVVCNEISKATQDKDVFPLILGGDHCIAIGTISAIKRTRKNSAVIWVKQFFGLQIPDFSLPFSFLLL
jgi:arginase family enzyme